MAEPEIHRTPTEARAASKPGIVRWILISSTALIIIAFTIIYLVMR
jgi:hypothetical protein